MRILVADDSSLYRTMLKTLLEEWGYEVVLASGGEEAQRILESGNPPQMAILYCQLPGVSGLNLCEQIRARTQGYVYTILLGAADEENDVLGGFEVGADDFLSKPFKRFELKARIRVGERFICTQETLLKENQALRVEASQDFLLRFWNRKAIMELLNTELSRAKRLQTPLSVAFIDLDLFKPVNDRHGHQVGDEVLRGVAKRVSEAVREYDHVGRCGGEEFLVVLPSCTAEGAREVAERVRQSVADEPIQVGNLSVRITLSCGVAQWRPGQEASDLLRESDVALYRAKENGRNRVEVETTSQTEAAPVIEPEEENRSYLPDAAGDDAPIRKRTEVRHRLALPIRIWGMDASGEMFEQYATTVDVTTTGAHIAGIRHRLQRGCVIGIEHRSSRARYRVTWVEHPEGDIPGKVGVQLIESGKFIWGRVIPRVFVDSEAGLSQARRIIAKE